MGPQRLVTFVISALEMFLLTYLLMYSLISMDGYLTAQQEIPFLYVHQSVVRKIVIDFATYPML